MKPIQMVDLQEEHFAIRSELDVAIARVIDHGQFIKGPEVERFEKTLALWWGTGEVIGCANGTDALYLAILALDLPKGAEVILPSFNYVSAAEVLIQAGLNPVFAEVDSQTFNLNPESVASCIGPKTKAIIVVHLFGQCAPMEEIMDLAQKYHLFVIEDNAQSLGAEIIQGKYKGRKAGTIGHLGTTSFFPTKILACMGDGGAVCTNDPELATAVRMLANHGQKQRYYYEKPGINSRLDTLQAAILEVKLKYIDQSINQRKSVAEQYDDAFSEYPMVIIPRRSAFSTHVFHQYTVRIHSQRRDELQQYLLQKKVPSVIYYPLPLHAQEAYRHLNNKGALKISEQLSHEVLSLPLHPNLKEDQIHFIVSVLSNFFTSDL